MRGISHGRTAARRAVAASVEASVAVVLQGHEDQSNAVRDMRSWVSD